MRTPKLAAWLVSAGVIFAQGDRTAQRLREALAGTGHADQAAEELAHRDYGSVDRLLASLAATDDKTRAEIASLRGAIAFLRRDMGGSVIDFEAARALAPLSDPDAFTEAMAFVSLGDRPKAREVLQRLAQSRPEDAIYIYWLGRLDYDEHRYDEAARELRRAISIDAHSARVWDSLGLTLDMQGEADQAGAAFERSVTLNREQRNPSPWPPHDFGYWLLRANRLQEAERALRESLGYDATFPEGHYHLGRTLEKEGRDSEAIAEYDAAVRSDASSSEACYSLGLLYRKLHRESDASAMFAEYKRRRQATP